MLTVRIRGRSGDVAVDELQPTAGLEYLLAHPQLVGVLCQFGARCRFGPKCRFIHFVTDALDAAARLCGLCDSAACTLVCAACTWGSCSTCLSRYVLMNWQPSLGDGDSAPLRCLKCAAAFSARDAARNLSAEAYSRYMDAQRRRMTVSFLGTLHGLVEDNRRDPAALVGALMALQLSLRFKGRSKMCPECDFGPVVLDGCDGLAVHRRDTLVGGATVSNSCPHCGFFSADAAAWQVWDGTVRSVDALRKPKTPVVERAATPLHHRRADADLPAEDPFVECDEEVDDDRSEDCFDDMDHWGWRRCKKEAMRGGARSLRAYLQRTEHQPRRSHRRR